MQEAYSGTKIWYEELILDVRKTAQKDDEQAPTAWWKDY